MKKNFGSVPVLLVESLEKATNFYLNELEFIRVEQPFSTGDCWLQKQETTVALRAASSSMGDTKATATVYCTVYQIEAYRRRLTERGLTVRPVEKFETSAAVWFTFSLRDPDGHQLIMVQPAARLLPHGNLNPTPVWLKGMWPVLPSYFPERDIDWYLKYTGFRCVYSSRDYGDQRGYIDYVVLRRDQLTIHLQWHAGTEADPVYGSMLKIEVDRVRPIFEEFLERGTVQAHQLRLNTPWGTNEFGFYDLNNNAIFFVESIRTTLSRYM